MNSNFKEENINHPNYWTWNGFKICWSVIGEDNENPIIFLHGFGASRKHWRKNLKYFAKRNCASYSLDLIGFGDSDQPGIRQIGRLNNEIWSNQVKDFIEQVVKPKNSRKVILIGNSLGSLVALTCAVSLEDQIATVIASPLPDQIHENKRKTTTKRLFKKFIDRFIKIFFIFLPLEIILFLITKLGVIRLGVNSAYFKKDNIDHELIDLVTKPVLRRTSARSLRAMCIGMSSRGENFQASYLLRKLSTSKKVPFLLIWGDKDNFIPLFVGKKIANFHRWVKLKIVSNSGHCIHDEDPSLFNRISYEWIRELKHFKI
ncbi:alpha/beta hydrolase superfamily protein [Prochlorococcus marinus str. MIT 9312]|uniref:Alpha/beta hydrolase superfamily protein n=1 Tax=Prochlorococcus marinus (strain MIT 9312) TaxID=74546 RepID=Q319Y4_PROM9|nr:alpha/beta fold hydrolase [Prochlorococcus marinus]ABB50311.1 alpha/beta hydrolase superfamily protein [Prochlorococcus marinus str. MIT 9312]KGF99899.1 putative alpha/beta hydrolase [Prochlorococcus marinus str. MIT 9311]